MSKSKAQQAKRNYSERLGEDRGDRYLSQQGYINRLNDKQKGIKQGHDAVYVDSRTRSPELDKSAQIVRERQQGGYSKIQVREAKRDLKHHHSQHGHIPSNKPEVVVAEFKGGTSKESKLQQQPDWTTNVAKDIRDRQGVYKNASQAERQVATEVLQAQKEGRLRYEVISSRKDHSGKITTEKIRTIKPAEHDGLYAAKSQKSLDNMDVLKSYREKLKEAKDRGDTKEEQRLKNKIQQDLPEQKKSIAKRQDFAQKQAIKRKGRS